MSQLNDRMDHEHQALVKQNTETDDVFQRMLEIRFDEPVTVKVKLQDDDPDYLHQGEALSEDSSDDYIDKKSPGTKNVIILGTKKTSRRKTDELSDQRHNKRSLIYLTGETIGNVQNQTVENNIYVNSEESIEIQKETRIIANEKVLPGNTNSILSYSENLKNAGADVEINASQEILAVNSNISKNEPKSSLNFTSNSEQKQITTIAKEEIIKTYKTFPRTKVTSRREIKKFPGKMDSMKKSIDKMKNDTKSPSLGTIEEIANSISYSPKQPEQNVHENDKTTSNISIQDSDSEDIHKNSEYQNILNGIIFDAQRSMKGELRPTESTTNSNLLSLQNITQSHIYNPRIEALKIVGENILVIFPYLNHFLQTRRLEGQDNEIFKKAQINFHACKIESFGLSYSTVVSFILPYKDNTVYMKEFYQLIAEMAKEKKMQDFSQKNLEILCSEMIAWAENKKLQIEVLSTNSRSGRQTGQISNTTPGNISLNQNSKLLRLLSTQTNMPLESPGNINQSKQQTNKMEPPPTLRFATGPPGREIQISYDSEIHRLNEPSAPSVQSNLIKSTVIKTNQMPHLNQWTSQVTPNVTVTETCNRAPWLANNPPQSNCDTASWQPTYQHQNAPFQTPTYPQAFESFCATRSPSLRPPPPPYNQIQTEAQIQQHEDQNSNNLRTSVIQERSSVSRDSGFMSPVGDNSAIDQMDNFTNDINVNIDCPTPIITHVTSMNPNAIISPHSKCKVCGTITNLRCRGCNRDYYCGPRCQGLDWETHKAFCHK